MHQMNELEQLKKVGKVEVPMFLYTRIQAKIRALEAEKTPVSWQISGAVAFCMLLFLNLATLRNYQPESRNSTQELVTGMQLTQTLQIYADTN